MPDDPRPAYGTLQVPTPDGLLKIPLGFSRTGPTSWEAYPLDDQPIVLSADMVITVDCIPPGHSVELDVVPPPAPVVVEPVWIRRT